MSAPDYNDPASKLKLRLRPLRGSSALLALACGLAIVGSFFCIFGFLASLWPGVVVDGNRLWLLAFAAVFAAAAGFFNWMRKLLRRFE